MSHIERSKNTAASFLRKCVCCAHWRAPTQYVRQFQRADVAATTCSVCLSGIPEPARRATPRQLVWSVGRIAA